MAVPYALALPVTAARSPLPRASMPMRRQSGLTVLPHHAQLVAVFDTNALATACCMEADSGHDSLVTRLVATERVPCFIADHVPGEMEEHLERISRSQHVDTADALRVWRDDVAPLLRVVELPIGEYLRPEIAAIRRPPPEGDPDDWPTLALAAFLGPTVVVSSDSVFARLGYNNAGYWTGDAKALHTASELEGRQIDRLHTALITTRLLWGGAAGIFHQVPRRAWLLPALGIAAGWAASMLWSSRDRVRATSAAVWESLEPIFARIGAELTQYDHLRSSLVAVHDPSWRQETLTERCARHLARSGTPMTPSELRDALDRTLGQRVSAAAIRRALSNHPAFIRSAGERYSIGRPVTA
ncbi:PIN domain-containing protein [Micromonospora sp. NPDC047793]|uniref:PIN domain-containing protein n=1 Tax=Micromonospora sp. NPDC047793 TaxID=3154342 RepID=UPI0033CD2761